MKLNIDCMRDVLLFIESCDYGVHPSFQSIVDSLPDYDKNDIAYTCDKLYEAGFIKAVIKNYIRNQSVVVKVTDITYEGHQFLENIRSQNVWSKVKENATKIGSFSIPVLQQIATTVISDLI